jgi:hypothetical protein
MQRCPECQFIYEDNDSHCDMDGSALVYAGSFEAISPLALPTAKSSRRGLLLLTVILALGAVLFADYYSFTHRSGPWGDAQRSAKETAESPTLTSVVPENAAAPVADSNKPSSVQVAIPAVSPSAVASAIAEVVTDNERIEKKTSGHAKGKPIAPPRATVKERSFRPKPEREHKQQDSKIGSILKKAGHFLKKPFKR